MDQHGKDTILWVAGAPHAVFHKSTVTELWLTPSLDNIFKLLSYFHVLYIFIYLFIYIFLLWSSIISSVSWLAKLFCATCFLAYWGGCTWTLLGWMYLDTILDTMENMLLKHLATLQNSFALQSCFLWDPNYHMTE